MDIKIKEKKKMEEEFYLKFKESVEARGYSATKYRNGHFKVYNGRYELNWWPFSKTRTVYVANTKQGIHNCDLDKVLELADDLPDVPYEQRINRNVSSNSYKNKKKRLLAKNNGIPICDICKKEIPEPEITVDHYIPLAKGGTNMFSNLRLAHKKCNLDKGSKVL